MITGYHTQINLAKAELPLTAIIRKGAAAGQSSTHLTKALSELPEVLECSRVTGSDAFIMKVVASSVEYLQRLIDWLVAYGPVTTSIVLSIPIKRRIVMPQATSAERRRKRLLFRSPFCASNLPYIISARGLVNGAQHQDTRHDDTKEILCILFCNFLNAFSQLDA